jgi:hypothetical protein
MEIPYLKNLKVRIARNEIPSPSTIFYIDMLSFFDNGKNIYINPQIRWPIQPIGNYIKPSNSLKSTKINHCKVLHLLQIAYFTKRIDRCILILST